MSQVVRRLDGVLAPIGCVSASHPVRCSQESTCRFRRVLLEIRSLTACIMDQATLARVHAQRPVTSKEVFTLDLLDGEGI